MKRFNTLCIGIAAWSVASIQTAFAETEAHDAVHAVEHAVEDMAVHAEEAVEAAAHAVAEAAHHGGGHGHEGSSAGLPQLDASTFPSQLFWLCVAFAILYFIFSKKSLPEISGVLENRQNHIQSDLETAEKLKSDAEAAHDTYEKGLQSARDEAAKTLNDVQEKIKAKAEKQADTFRQKTEKEILALEEKLFAAKENALDDMNTIAAEIASEAAKKIVGINPDIEQAKTVVKALNGNTKAKAA